MSIGLQLYLDFVVFVFGAVIGSFLNVCIHRLPREQSIVNPPSHCPHCNERVRWFDNIPLVSFLVLRGKCRYCCAAITPRYFVVELLTAVLFLALWWSYGVTWYALIYAVLVAGLIAATFIDFEHYIIPDEITLGGIVLGVLLSGLCPVLHGTTMSGAALLRSLAGAVVGGVTLLVIALAGEKIFKKEAMGMGDVKLLAAIGAFLGWKATLFVVFLSSLLGGVAGLVLVVGKRKEWGSRLPYGPYIALAAVQWLFWGPTAVLWYLRSLTGE
jgi:leader peptidase (prepilin peptidase)/N-methyltransferase